jgi:divalent metal cation (Fe/Co/Zn/Cd) transporter
MPPERGNTRLMAADITEPAATERLGRRLQWATIGWNCLEVFVTIGLGIAARSLALVAFGLDSMVEVFASLVVIWHMTPGDGGHAVGRDRRALRLVGIAFALLAAYLVVAGVRNLVVHEAAGDSPLGIAYLAVTAVVMFGLARWKRRVGRVLQSDPFLAEASMTFLDGCLATSILVALALNLTLGWWWADPIAALLFGAVAVREAVESWREAGELGDGEPMDGRR